MTNIKIVNHYRRCSCNCRTDIPDVYCIRRNNDKDWGDGSFQHNFRCTKTTLDDGTTDSNVQNLLRIPIENEKILDQDPCTMD